MRFFFDHDVPNHLGEFLKRHHHEVTFVREVMRPDATVFEYAIKRNAIMVACNKNDFLKLAEQKLRRGKKV